MAGYIKWLHINLLQLSVLIIFVHSNIHVVIQICSHCISKKMYMKPATHCLKYATVIVFISSANQCEPWLIRDDSPESMEHCTPSTCNPRE